MTSYIGRTVTSQLKIETRQHEVAGLDLGEGPRRRDLILGALIVPAWIALVWLFLGPPTKWTMLLYLAPPIILLTQGILDSDKNPRRMRLTMLVMSLRYMIVGHHPVIRIGARKASRSERLPAYIRFKYAQVVRGIYRDEWATPDGKVNWEHFAQMPLMGRLANRTSKDVEDTAGPAINLKPTAYLYSTDEAVAIAHRYRQKTTKKKVTS